MDILGRAKRQNGRTILIIDDDIIAQNMIRSTLTGAGYSVIVASNGNDGIEKAIGQLRSARQREFLEPLLFIPLVL